VYHNDGCCAAIVEWIWRNLEPPISLFPYPPVDGQDWIAAHRKFFPLELEEVLEAEATLRKQARRRRDKSKY
jgi:hypothetical protein